MVIWITGLSASGKTTLSKALEKKIRQNTSGIVLLDGDSVRQLYGDDLGYEEPDRFTQIKRIQNLAVFLEKQSLIVIVAALYAHPDLLEYNRKTFQEYFEIYLKGTIESLQKREFKDLYKKALNKEILNVVGVDIPWHEPVNADLLFELEDNYKPDEMAEVIFQKLQLS
jgi:adenylylsulfate kinase-like enzyme